MSSTIASTSPEAAVGIVLERIVGFVNDERDHGRAIVTDDIRDAFIDWIHAEGCDVVRQSDLHEDGAQCYEALGIDQEEYEREHALASQVAEYDVPARERLDVIEAQAEAYHREHDDRFPVRLCADARCRAVVESLGSLDYMLDEWVPR